MGLGLGFGLGLGLGLEVLRVPPMDVGEQRGLGVVRLRLQQCEGRREELLPVE